MYLVLFFIFVMVTLKTPVRYFLISERLLWRIKAKLCLKFKLYSLVEKRKRKKKRQQHGSRIHTREARKCGKHEKSWENKAGGVSRAHIREFDVYSKIVPYQSFDRPNIQSRLNIYFPCDNINRRNEHPPPHRKRAKRFAIFFIKNVDVAWAISISEWINHSRRFYSLFGAVFH